MTELLGFGAALLGSALGGTAVAATRFAVGAIDPLNVAMLRYGIGALVLLPFAFRAVPRLKGKGDVAASVGLGLLFFALYPYAFALALKHTTAVRGSLALATMPLMTLAFAILLRQETFAWTRLAGVLVAMGGIAYALSPGLGAVAPEAWKGDLIMLAATAMQAVYNVLARPYVQRIGALPFTAFGMVVGAIALACICAFLGLYGQLAGLTPLAWSAIAYLGLIGSALLWVLWGIGLRLASPTMVALSVTANVLTAAGLGAMVLGEPLGLEFAVGLLAVLLGIGVAMSWSRRQ